MLLRVGLGRGARPDLHRRGLARGPLRGRVLRGGRGHEAVAQQLRARGPHGGVDPEAGRGDVPRVRPQALGDLRGRLGLRRVGRGRWARLRFGGAGGGGEAFVFWGGGVDTAPLARPPPKKGSIDRTPKSYRD